jgi:hypothetical protein
LDYEAAQHCDLTTATEQFGRSGYGIGLPKNSFWAERVNQEVLAMHESGFMEELDQKWIRMGVDNYDDNCPTVAERQKPASLTLYNMAGVFILVGIGIVGGVGLIGIEVIYKKSQVKQQRQLDVARHAAERWKRLVEVRPQSTQTDARGKKKNKQSALKQMIEVDAADETDQGASPEPGASASGRASAAAVTPSKNTSAKEREANLVNDVIETV